MDCVSDISNLRNLLISGLLLLLRIWSVAFHGVFEYWFLSHACRSNPLSTKVDSQAEAGLDPCSSGTLLLSLCGGAAKAAGGPFPADHSGTSQVESHHSSNPPGIYKIARPLLLSSASSPFSSHLISSSRGVMVTPLRVFLLSVPA